MGHRLFFCALYSCSMSEAGSKKQFIAARSVALILEFAERGVAVNSPEPLPQMPLVVVGCMLSTRNQVLLEPCRPRSWRPVCCLAGPAPVSQSSEPLQQLELRFTANSASQRVVHWYFAEHVMTARSYLQCSQGCVVPAISPCCIST